MDLESKLFRIKPAMGLLMALLISLQVAAAPTIFTVSNEPPPGFEFLNQPQMTLVDVYYAGEVLDKPTIVSFTLHKLKFQNPAQLVEQLPGVVDRAAVVKALTGELDAHATLVCGNKTDGQCGRLNPEVAGVIFDAAKFKAYIFINQRYIEKTKPPDLYLAPPKLGFSAYDRMYGVASGELNQTNNNSYNVTNQLATAYDNIRMNVNSAYIYNQNYIQNYNQNLQAIPYTNTFQITDWYLTYTKQRYQLQTGMLQTTGSMILGNQFFLGAAAGTTLQTLVNPEQSYGIPLELFLPLPSRVSIYRDNRLLQSAFYEAGNQIIDTSFLPTGAYEIKLVITDNQGFTKEETRFFVKSNQLPPLGQPQYGIAAGVLQSQQINADRLFPRYSSKPLAQLWSGVRMGQNWGINNSLTGSSDRAFLESGIFLLSQHYQFTPGMLVSTKGEVGVTAANTWSYNRFTAGLSAMQLLNRHEEITLQQLFNNFDANYNPLLYSPRTRANLNLGYSWTRTTLSLSNYFFKYDDRPEQYSIGSTLRTLLFRGKDVDTNLELNATKFQDGYLVYSQISISFNDSPWQANSTLGYRKTAFNQQRQDEIYGNANLKWSSYDANQEGWGVAGLASRDNQSNSFGTSVERTGSFYKANASLRRNQQTNGYDNTQYTAYFDTSLAYTDKSIMLGASDSAQGTGISVYVKSEEKKGSFDVYINGQRHKTIKLNKPEIIYLTPYRVYQVSIRDASDKGFFKYDEKPKKVALYQANIAKLVWEADQEIAIYGVVTYPDGKPVANALVTGAAEFSTTDEQGQLLAEIIKNKRQLTLAPAVGSACVITLDKPQPVDGFAMVDKMVCVPIDKSKVDDRK